MLWRNVFIHISIICSTGPVYILVEQLARDTCTHTAFFHRFSKHLQLSAARARTLPSNVIGGFELLCSPNKIDAVASRNNAVQCKPNLVSVSLVPRSLGSRSPGFWVLIPDPRSLAPLSIASRMSHSTLILCKASIFK